MYHDVGFLYHDVCFLSWDNVWSKLFGGLFQRSSEEGLSAVASAVCQIKCQSYELYTQRSCIIPCLHGTSFKLVLERVGAFNERISHLTLSSVLVQLYPQLSTSVVVMPCEANSMECLTVDTGLGLYSTCPINADLRDSVVNQLDTRNALHHQCWLHYMHGPL